MLGQEIAYIVVAAALLVGMAVFGKKVPKRARAHASTCALVVIALLVGWGYYIKSTHDKKTVEAMAQGRCMKGCARANEDSGNCTGEGEDRVCPYTCNLPPGEVGNPRHCQYDSDCHPCGQTIDPDSESDQGGSPGTGRSVPGLTVDAWPREGCKGPLALKVSMPDNTCSRMLIKGDGAEVERYVRFDGDCKKGGILKSWLVSNGGCTGHPYKQTRISRAELGEGKCHDGGNASMKVRCGSWKPGHYGPGEPHEDSNGMLGPGGEQQFPSSGMLGPGGEQRDPESGMLGPGGEQRHPGSGRRRPGEGQRHLPTERGGMYPRAFNRGYDQGYNQAFDDAYSAGFETGQAKGRRQGCPHAEDQQSTCPNKRLSCEYRNAYQPPRGSFGSPLNTYQRCAPSVTGAFTSCGPSAANGGCYRGQSR